MHVRTYPKAERERLYPEGRDMAFGGGTHFMRPEAAERLAYGLVKQDRPTGMYRRAQVAPVDERMIIENAKARAREQAGSDLPAAWSSLRPHLKPPETP